MTLHLKENNAKEYLRRSQCHTCRLTAWIPLLDHKDCQSPSSLDSHRGPSTGKQVNYAILGRILDSSNNRKEIQTVEPTATPWEESHLAPETDNTSLNIFIANMTSAYTETVSSPMLTESNSVKRGSHESYVNFLHQGQKLKEKLQGSDFSHVLRVPTDIILSP